MTEQQPQQEVVVVVQEQEQEEKKTWTYHHYLLHIPHDDRSTKFMLMPQEKWIPDDCAAGCQFDNCETLFNFFQRRHHCRR